MRSVSKLTMMAVLLLGLHSVAGAVPNLMNYQGRLTDAAGNPTNGNQSVVFSIFAAASGGSALWTETQNVTVSNGLFNVLLGSVTAFPANLFSGSNLFLAIKVGADAEMTPRQQIASVGYAQRAGLVDVQPGIASRGFTNRSGTANTTVIIDSVDITIPAAGFIEVEGGGNHYMFHVNTQSTSTRFKMSETRFDTGFEASYIEYPYDSDLPSGLYEHSVVCHRVYSKAAGTYRFYFNMGCSGATAGNIQAGWITAKYYPAALGTVNAPQPEPGSRSSELDRPASERNPERP